MAFMGLIQMGTDVRITLSSNFTNAGSALLAAGVGRAGGEDSQITTVAPGGGKTLTLRCEEEGLLKIEVDFTLESDSGRLEVERGALPPHRENITGDKVWRYAVVEEAVAEPTP